MYKRGCIWGTQICVTRSGTAILISDITLRVVERLVNPHTYSTVQVFRRDSPGKDGAVDGKVHS
jgi:hypothetical protein